MPLNDSPGSAGVITIMVGCIVVSWIITFVTGSYAHWPFVLAGIVAGLLAVSSINK
jgi:hypothetical protein